MAPLADPVRSLQAGRAVTVLLVLSAWLAAIFGTSVAVDPVRAPAAWSPFEAASVQQGEALRSVPAEADRDRPGGLDLDGDRPAFVSADPVSTDALGAASAEYRLPAVELHPPFRARAPPAF